MSAAQASYANNAVYISSFFEAQLIRRIQLTLISFCIRKQIQKQDIAQKQ